MVFGDDHDDLTRSLFARLPPAGLLACCALLVLFIAVADYSSGQLSSDLSTWCRLPSRPGTAAAAAGC
jgi:hypothetical protein